MERTIDEITTELAEYFCDTLCKYPYEADEDELPDICASCKMGDYITELCKKEVL